MVPSWKARPGEDVAEFSVSEQPLVLGLDQIVEALRRRDLVLLEVGAVVVDADVAVVERGDAVLGLVELELARDAVQALGLVRAEDALVQAAREQGVVDAEEHIALRVALGQDRLVDGLAGIAALEHLDLVAALLLERGQHRLGHVEGVVADERDGLGVRVAPPPPEPPHAARAVIPTAAASAVAMTLLVVLTDFLLAGQEETRPRPGSTAGDVEGRTGQRTGAGRNSMSDDRTSYPE